MSETTDSLRKQFEEALEKNKQLQAQIKNYELEKTLTKKGITDPRDVALIKATIGEVDKAEDIDAFVENYKQEYGITAAGSTTSENVEEETVTETSKNSGLSDEQKAAIAKQQQLNANSPTDNKTLTIEDFKAELAAAKPGEAQSILQKYQSMLPQS